jgi:hypothetical protein
LWDNPILRPQIVRLLQTREGAQFLLRAIDNDPQQIRDINRFLSGARRNQESAALP